MKNFCKKCLSEAEALGKSGFCEGCDKAIKRGKKQTKDIKSGKLKIAKVVKKKSLKDKPSKGKTSKKKK